MNLLKNDKVLYIGAGILGMAITGKIMYKSGQLDLVQQIVDVADAAKGECAIDCLTKTGKKIGLNIRSVTKF